MRKFELKNSNNLNQNTESQKKNGSIVSSTSALKVYQDIQECGSFVKEIENGTQCNLLLDKGAILTILSDHLYTEIDKTSKSLLSTITQRIVGAAGIPLTEQGKGLF
jgi:hypothetical protein